MENLCLKMPEHLMMPFKMLLTLAMCHDKNDGFVSAMVLLFCITEIILPILRSVAGCE